MQRLAVGFTFLILLLSSAQAEDIRVYRQGEIPDPAEVSRILGGTGDGGLKGGSKLKIRGVKDRGENMAELTQPPKPSALSLPVNFDLNSASIRNDAYPALEAILTGIRHSENKHLIIIEGHTDATGSRTYNETLSRKRAESVKQFLVAQGVLPSRLQAIGYGDHRLLKPEEPFAPENRRVQFRAAQ
ncbi:MAG: OmpA family protein [Alphaproteobacteria bacterium]|nr:OmpA family protein [Alphaproteobacteria bacterium]